MEPTAQTVWTATPARVSLVSVAFIVRPTHKTALRGKTHPPFAFLFKLTLIYILFILCLYHNIYTHTAFTVLLTTVNCFGHLQLILRFFLRGVQKKNKPDQPSLKRHNRTGRRLGQIYDYVALETELLLYLCLDYPLALPLVDKPPCKYMIGFFPRTWDMTKKITYKGWVWKPKAVHPQSRFIRGT